MDFSPRPPNLQDVWVRHERLGCVLNLPIMWADMDPNLEKLETGGAWRKVGSGLEGRGFRVKGLGSRVAG